MKAEIDKSSMQKLMQGEMRALEERTALQQQIRAMQVQIQALAMHKQGQPEPTPFLPRPVLAEQEPTPVPLVSIGSQGLPTMAGADKLAQMATKADSRGQIAKARRAVLSDGGGGFSRNQRWNLEAGEISSP